MLIKSILLKYKWRLILTLFLILSESLLGILFPLFIGKSISAVLNQDTSGIINLGILGLVLVIFGGFRRLYDSRLYAKIYTHLSVRTLAKMDQDNPSVKTARLNMLAEMVDFSENQLPDIIQHSIGLIGIIIIIGFLNLTIFFGAIIAALIILALYWITSDKTYKVNTELNNEMETQVQVVSMNQASVLKFHLKELMKWNIKLSDIETINYSISWLIMLCLLLASIGISVSGNNLEYGVLFALIMYVYQYIESVVSLPLYYQQWLRLKEISNRTENI